MEVRMSPCWIQMTLGHNRWTDGEQALKVDFQEVWETSSYIQSSPWVPRWSKKTEYKCIWKMSELASGEESSSEEEGSKPQESDAVQMPWF